MAKLYSYKTTIHFFMPNGYKIARGKTRESDHVMTRLNNDGTAKWVRAGMADAGYSTKCYMAVIRKA